MCDNTRNILEFNYTLILPPWILLNYSFKWLFRVQDCQLLYRGFISGGVKIWILCSSGKNIILLVRYAYCIEISFSVQQHWHEVQRHSYMQHRICLFNFQSFSSCLSRSLLARRAFGNNRNFSKRVNSNTFVPLKMAWLWSRISDSGLLLFSPVPYNVT